VHDASSYTGAVPRSIHRIGKNSCVQYVEADRVSFVARLRPDRIRIDPGWRTFGETIEGLVGVLVKTRALKADAAAGARQAVEAREVESSTALLDIHVGVPHARMRGLRQSIVALGVSGQGLYEAVPTVPIQIVALVLSSPDATDDHLQILAGIATLLRSADLRAALLAARAGDEVLAALVRHARPMP
jgi:mannitol/fructose-specific phosphotransferase system IIA component (Ntr-type)